MSSYGSPVNEGAESSHRGIKHSRPQDDPPAKKRRKPVFDGILIPQFPHSPERSRSSHRKASSSRLSSETLTKSNASAAPDMDGPSPPSPVEMDFQQGDPQHNDCSLDGDYIHSSASSSSDDDYCAESDDAPHKAAPSHVRSTNRDRPIATRQEDEESTDEELMNKERGADKATEEDERHNNLRNPPPSPFLVTSDVRNRLDPRLVSIRKGVFAWKDGRHQCDHETGRNIPKDAPVNSSCALLSFLNGMYFCPLLGGILCPAHHCIVPYSDIPSHLTLHKIALRCCSLTPRVIQSHVHNEFDIPEMLNMASITEHISSLRLSSPIPGLHLPDLCMQCPSCKGWLVSRDTHLCKGLYNHWN
jgi:hypothetical protein